ncbi:MAG TPA: multicopper oxidase domain-containing protein [Blastocatellia bacterium]|nr:multicopper oxidase domain-containing protein [Blastocatellia bacterium]
MSNISKRNRSREREMENAAKNRREIIAARLSRRDMIKAGLLTGAGFLIPKRGLSAWALNSAGEPTGWMASPPAAPFIQPLFIPPIAQPVADAAALTGPLPQQAPNTAAGEGRTRPHQAFLTKPPVKFYEVHQHEALLSVHPDYPDQRLWTFNGTVPGQTYVANYNEAILVRNFNDLPNDNGGFGIPEVSTHLHNGHTPSESDGFPCDFYGQGKFYDQHYPNVLAGFDSTHIPTGGDIRESMSTLWYHDHRADFTAQNVYKGLAGFYYLFNHLDTGNENTGFRLPSFPEFDVPMMFNDKNFNSDERLVFDLANRDGILGDRFLVNGKIQPYFNVKRRRYRFRWLNGGPSRFYRFFLTNMNNKSQQIPFWVIANDGNLLPNPVQVTNTFISVAERYDVIIDFRQFQPGQRIYIENRQLQTNGAGPTNTILGAGQGNLMLEFRIQDDTPTDGSVDPATNPHFYDVPTRRAPRIERRFDFNRSSGQWVINSELFDCDDVRFRVRKNSAEHWHLRNGRNWSHPIHIHFEEHQVLWRESGPVPLVERARKDVIRLGEQEEVMLFFQFRDFVGRYPMHCHNTIHEDHAMMLRFDIDANGDDEDQP